MLLCGLHFIGTLKFIDFPLGVTCHYSAAAGAPKKKIQTTLTNLVVKGTDLIIQETQQKLGNFVSQNYISFCYLNV